MTHTKSRQPFQRPGTFAPQSQYLQRSEHRQNLLSFHRKWLGELNHTCQFCGKEGLGKKRKGQYGKYNFHHSCNSAYGNENPGSNYLLLCKRCHWLVHLLGGEIMLRDGNVERQNRRAKKAGRPGLPNELQRGFNWICIFPGSLGGLIQAVVVATFLAGIVAAIVF